MGIFLQRKLNNTSDDGKLNLNIDTIKIINST